MTVFVRATGLFNGKPDFQTPRERKSLNRKYISAIIGVFLLGSAIVPSHRGRDIVLRCGIQMALSAPLVDGQRLIFVVYSTDVLYRALHDDSQSVPTAAPVASVSLSNVTSSRAPSPIELTTFKVICNFNSQHIRQFKCLSQSMLRVTLIYVLALSLKRPAL